MLLDSTAVRAHVSAAGAPKHKEADPALGRSRGGFGTQIHILADLRGRPLRLRVTGGQIADRAYDSDGFRAWWAQRGIEAVIPARRGRTHPQPHDPERYKARKAVERGLGGLKPWRRVATRYDKHAQRFLGFLYLATAWLWLQS